MTQFGREVEQAEEAWLQGIRQGNALLCASVYEGGAYSCPPGRPMAAGLEAIQASWQSELDRGVRDADYNTLIAVEQGGLGFEVGTYVFKVTPPGSGEQLEERGKYIGVYRVGTDGSVKIVADCWNHDSPTG